MEVTLPCRLRAALVIAGCMVPALALAQADTHDHGASIAAQRPTPDLNIEYGVRSIPLPSLQRPGGPPAPGAPGSGPAPQPGPGPGPGAGPAPGPGPGGPGPGMPSPGPGPGAGPGPGPGGPGPGAPPT